jgi:hypothetical protein
MSEREQYLLGLCATVLAGAFYPSATIERERSGELKYFGENSYDTKAIPVESEEVQEVEEKQGTEPS